ncbi:hypothetical protein ACUOFC_44000, partial [Escherichia sp. TWPC-MK]
KIVEQFINVDIQAVAEVAIALLDMAGDTGAAAGLGEHFTRFKTRYLAGKTQHLGSITAEQLESV